MSATPLTTTAALEAKNGPPSYAFLRDLGPLLHARGLSSGDATGGPALGQLAPADYEAAFAGALATAGMALTPAVQAGTKAYPELFCLWDQHLDLIDGVQDTHCTLYIYLLPARSAASPRGEPGWELSVTRRVDDGSSTSTAQVRAGFVARAAQALAADLKAARGLSQTAR